MLLGASGRSWGLVGAHGRPQIPDPFLDPFGLNVPSKPQILDPFGLSTHSTPQILSPFGLNTPSKPQILDFT